MAEFMRVIEIYNAYTSIEWLYIYYTFFNHGMLGGANAST